MPQQEKSYVLGLDIGVTSVGWGIIDMETQEIVDTGVRLFEEGTAEENAKRREFRSARRLHRRRKHRLERLRKLLEAYHIISEDTELTLPKNVTPYHIRVKGLTEKLTGEELAIALLHIAKRRGTDNIAIIEDNEKEADELTKTKDILAKHKRELRDKEICELQLAQLRKNGSVRGIENRFDTKYYIREVKKLLVRQNIDPSLTKDIIEIISKRRAYYDGPGSEKSPTMYGQYFYDKAGNLQHVGMIEKMRGKCSLYPDRPRAARYSFTAELFSFLNQLNNLTINGEEKISPEQKRTIVEKYVIPKSGITPRQLAKELGVNLVDISGFLQTKKGDPVLMYGKSGKQNKFVGLRALRKALEGTDESIVDNALEHRGLIDQIMDILSADKDISERTEKLRAIDTVILTDDIIHAIAGISGISNYANLSYDAMNDMMDDLWNTTKNQMQIITDGGLLGAHSAQNLVGKDIPFREDEIYSPVARRAEREAIKVVNAVRKKYGEMESIVIEMAREKNSDERQKNIKKWQKKFSQEKDAALKKIGNRRIAYGEGKAILKMRLYEQQEGKCIYTGDPIDLDILLADDKAYEVDHIIPLSVSFDDSLANKVLCTQSANQQKGQRTPYAWLSSGGASVSYEAFKARVLALNNVPRRKKQNLLFEGDITKHDVRKGFINRNLVDTRYATKALLNMLQDYMRANDIPTKIHTIRGSFTSAFRKRIGLHKDRDENHAHHAIDALIVAGLKKLDLFRNVMRIHTQKDVDGNTQAYSADTGEILTQENQSDYFPEDFMKFIKSLRDHAPGRIRFSHKVDRKPNRMVTDQTLYGTRVINDERHKIGKYKDIYGQEGEKVAKLLKDEEKAKKKLLMAKYDPVTFQLLLDIVKTYAGEKNPFARYKEEHGPLRKCGKPNGPIIKSLRYDAGKVSIHQDVSHKYNAPAQTVIHTSLKPYRVDIYQAPDGRYKFLRLTYMHLEPVRSERQKRLRLPTIHYRVRENLYEQEKQSRGIDAQDTFVFSLHKHELFGFTKKGEGEEEKVVKLNGVYSYNAGKLEYKEIDYHAKEQLYLSIGTLKDMSKYSTNTLGHRYRVGREPCKMTISII